jgi:hypothetical protein
MFRCHTVIGLTLDSRSVVATFVLRAAARHAASVFTHLRPPGLNVDSAAVYLAPIRGASSGKVVNLHRDWKT